MIRKFSRILGELFHSGNEVSINQQMINDHHAVPYTGNKEEIEKGHLANREILIEQGSSLRNTTRIRTMTISVMDIFYIVMIV